MSLEWAQSLAGVALGGLIAAWTGKAGAERSAKREALVAVAAVAVVQSNPFYGDEDEEVIAQTRFDARTALLEGGVPGPTSK